MRLGRLVGVALAVAITAVPSAAPAAQIVINPFGNLQLAILAEPTPTAPGSARLTIVTANGAAFSGGSKIYFGLRIMGTEDVELSTFRVTDPLGGCIVSDFAGRNTSGGWQGAEAFGTTTPAGSLNSHMRMVGGFLKKACGNLEIDVTFRARPLVTYYAAFFAYKAAPWVNNHDTSPWTVIPTGGDSRYRNWWNIWGQFDTLGYSNACTNVSGTVVSCG